MSRLGKHVRRQGGPAEADVLLAASGHGDSEAFATFYDKTGPLIFALVRRGLGDRGDAAAATERIYVRLWRAAPRFEVAHDCAYGLLLAATRRELACRLGRAEVNPGRPPA